MLSGQADEGNHRHHEEYDGSGTDGDCKILPFKESQMEELDAMADAIVNSMK